METLKEFEIAYPQKPSYPRAYTQPLSRKSRMYELCKRGMDLVVSIAGLTVLSPLFLLVAVRIKWDDPRGRIFFWQIRIGKDGQPFQMVKFRSMVTGAENSLDHLLERNEIAGKMFKMKEDPRITKFGKFLRKSSIDELPQLWNVVCGQMSLVGPRPPLPREAEQYSSREKQRLSVVPGCSGLWQVSGRNGLSFDDMVELDLIYIRNRNLRLDFLLIMRTVKEMIFSKNAY